MNAAEQPRREAPDESGQGGGDFQFDLGFNVPGGGADFDLPPPDHAPAPPVRGSQPLRVLKPGDEPPADESSDDVPVGEGYRRMSATLPRIPTAFDLHSVDSELEEELATGGTGGPEPTIERTFDLLGIRGDAVSREPDALRIFCPIHRDQVRRSMRIDLATRRYKCQFKQCPGHAGGDLVDLVALTLGVSLAEARSRLSSATQELRTPHRDLVDRAQAHIDRLEYAQALPLLQEAVEVSPRDEVTRCRLASLQLEMGRRDDGVQNYLIAAEDYGVRGELDKTLHIYKLLVLVDPNDLAVHEQMAYVAARLGDEDDAINRFAWIVDQYIERGELDAALGRVDHLLQLRPQSVDFLLLKADLLMGNGMTGACAELIAFEVQQAVAREDLEVALRLANKGAELFPQNALLFHLRDEVANELTRRGSDPEVMTAQMKKLEEDAPAASPEEDDFRQWILDLEEKIQPMEERVKRASSSREMSRIDERVIFCRDNLRGFDSAKMLKMYRHLKDMYRDVRESFDRGELTELEKKVIKDFYTSFCIAFKEYNKEVTGDSMLTRF